MIQELLTKYKDQKPKEFGNDYVERSYPVGAVIAMLEEQRNAYLEIVKELRELHKHPFYRMEIEYTDFKGNKLPVYTDDEKIKWAYAYNALVDHIMKTKELVDKL